jgi:class 3 adenylate cyclase
VKTQEELTRESARRKPTSLFDVFPKKVAEALNAGKKVEAETHEMVSIFFSDIVGFTTISQSLNALKVSNMLDRLYTVFDNLSRKHKIFKVETIGDAWMGVTNLDNEEGESHARQIAEFAQDAIRSACNIAIDEDDLSLGYLNIRVGLHSGPVVANVVGSLNPRYALFGDAVNTASRMESNSLPGRIQCSFSTAELLKHQAPEIPLELRGNVKIKGKGVMKTFWVGPENLAMTPPSTFSARVMEPLSERDDEDHTEGQYEHSESENVSEMNDSFHGITAKTGVVPSAAPIDVFSIRTAATASPGDSVSSDGSHSGENHRSPSLKSHLGHSHQPVKIGMDGTLEPIPSDDFPISEV